MGMDPEEAWQSAIASAETGELDFVAKHNIKGIRVLYEEIYRRPMLEEIAHYIDAVYYTEGKVNVAEEAKERLAGVEGVSVADKAGLGQASGEGDEAEGLAEKDPAAEQIIAGPPTAAEETAEVTGQIAKAAGRGSIEGSPWTPFRRAAYG